MRLFTLFAFLFLAGIYGCKKDRTSATLPLNSYIGKYAVSEICLVTNGAPGGKDYSDTTLSEETIAVYSDISITFEGQIYNCTTTASDTATSYTFAIPASFHGAFAITFANPPNGTFTGYFNYPTSPVQSNFCTLKGIEN